MIETYILELPASESRQAKPHLPGILEHVVVLKGEMRAGPAAHPQSLRAGQSMSFAADVDHIYAAGNETCRALVSVVYPEITPGTPDHDLAWPASGPDWDAMTAILTRATVEVQNGLGVSVTTFRASPVARIPEEGLDRLRHHVEGLPPSPAVRRFLVTSADPAVIALYRGSHMRGLGPRPQGLSGALGARCWDLARQAVQRNVGGDAARLEDVARTPGSIIEAALAAEVLTRAGRPTVPHGINVQTARTDRGSSDGRRLFEDRIDVDAYEAYELVHPAYARQTLAVAGALPAVEGLRILDVGTGPGLPLAMLRELRPDLSALAVDPSEVAVAHLVTAGEDQGGPLRGPWLIALGLTVLLVWVAGTGVGNAAGDALQAFSPHLASTLDFALPALFLSLVLATARQSIHLPMLLAAGIAALLLGLGRPELAVPLAALAALLPRRRTA